MITLHPCTIVKIMWVKVEQPNSFSMCGLGILVYLYNGNSPSLGSGYSNPKTYMQMNTWIQAIESFECKHNSNTNQREYKILVAQLRQNIIELCVVKRGLRYYWSYVLLPKQIACLAILDFMPMLELMLIVNPTW